MLTEQEIDVVRNSDVVEVEDVLYGKLNLENMEEYFRREMKENLLEQGWELPEYLKDPDDDTAPVPEYLREKPDPDIRSRYNGVYDGNQEDDIPHYGSRFYWQWLDVKGGRINYLRGYDLDGNEIKIPRWLYGKILIQVRDYLMSEISNPISHKEYQMFKVNKEHLDIEELEGLSFVTCYLF